MSPCVVKITEAPLKQRPPSHGMLTKRIYELLSRKQTYIGVGYRLPVNSIGRRAPLPIGLRTREQRNDLLASIWEKRDQFEQAGGHDNKNTLHTCLVKNHLPTTEMADRHNIEERIIRLLAQSTGNCSFLNGTSFQSEVWTIL